MKLWEKNYLLTYLLFILVLNAGLFLLAAQTFKNDFTRTVEAAAMEAKNINYSLLRLYPIGMGNIIAEYSLNGTYLKIFSGNEMIAGAHNDDLLEIEIDRAKLIERKGKKYLGIPDTIRVKKGQQYVKLNVFYYKDLEDVYVQQSKRLFCIVAASLLLSGIVGALLYFSMKKIYKPISNIAHELKTPLTGLQGYAQYMMEGKISHEDRQFALEQIAKDTEELKNIIDRMLIMGSLKKESLHYSTIDMNSFIEDFKTLYPEMIVNNKIDTFYGDETLIKCVLTNLLSNAFRAGGPVKLTAWLSCKPKQKNLFHLAKKCTSMKGTQIMIAISDHGGGISAENIKRLNKNLNLNEREILGTGKGIHICHEIVKLHKGRMYFEMREGGITVTIILPN